MANVKGVKETWAVITDEPPTLDTLWPYALRFRVEELFLDSKSGVFELEASGIRSALALEHLYLISAVAILYGTTQGMAVQLNGLRAQVAPMGHGVSAISISAFAGSEMLSTKGVRCSNPFTIDPEPCFASKNAEARYYERIWFSRIQSVRCQRPLPEEPKTTASHLVMFSYPYRSIASHKCRDRQMQYCKS